MRVEWASPRHGEATSQAPHPPTTGRSTIARREGCLERGAAAMSSMGYEARARPEARTAEFEVAGAVEPWAMTAHKNPGRGKDGWDLSLWTAAWLIRRHLCSRSRPFHPV